MASATAASEIASLLKSKVRSVQNFPFPGAVLRDISPLLGDSKSRASVMNFIAQQSLATVAIDVVAGIEPRGTLLAPFIAAALDKPYVVIRKASKLPNTLQISFKLPFGDDTLEVTQGDLAAGQKVLIVDDILAAGIATAAACELVEKTGATIAATFGLIELEGLNGRKYISDKGYTVAPSVLQMPLKD